MMRRAAIATTLTIAALAGGTGADAQAPSLPSDAVATVGSQAITTTTFMHWLDVAVRAPAGEPSKMAPAPGTPEWEAFRDQVMQFLITSAWLYAEAAEQGVAVTPEQVRASFERTKKQNFPTEKDFQQFLAESGMTIDDLLFRVEINALSDRLRERVTRAIAKPTETQLRRYYREHKRSFRRRRLHEAYVVGTRTKRAAQRALDAVRAGRSWRSQGGEWQVAQNIPLRPRLAWAIRNAAKRVPSGPVKSRGRWFVFELRRIRPARQQTYAQARTAVRQMLQAEAQQRALDAFVTGFHGQWRAQTVCRRDYAVRDCGTIVD